VMAKYIVRTVAAGERRDGESHSTIGPALAEMNGVWGTTDIPMAELHRWDKPRLHDRGVIETWTSNSGEVYHRVMLEQRRRDENGLG
jgi:hypothetical protein